MFSIIYDGDIFQSGAQTITVPVNCVGTMGAGLAKEFRSRFPLMYDDYRERCKIGEMFLGVPSLFVQAQKPHILLFPTKRHWKEKSDLSNIRAGLFYLKKRFYEWEIVSLALPALGCGLGGLPWPLVRESIVDILGDFPIALYAPKNIKQGGSVR